MTNRCPHTDPIMVKNRPFSAARVIELLAPMMNEERRARIETVVAQRTYTITPVVEGLFDRGNANAVMRSAEGMGYQAMHVIDSSPKFKEAKRVTQGAEKWLDVTTWGDTTACLDHLESCGYRLLATHLDPQARPIGEYTFDSPTAVILGNEREGVSDEVLRRCHGSVILPMHGFSQSYNISVAAALTLYHIQQERIRTLGAHGDLDDATRQLLTAVYYLRSVHASDKILLASER